MAGVLRGEIYWCDLEPVRGHEQGGRRPVMIISHDVFNARSGTVIAMPLTTKPQRAGYPLTWKVPFDLVQREAWVKVSQVRTISSGRLGRRIGRVDAMDIQEVVDGLLELIS